MPRSRATSTGRTVAATNRFVVSHRMAGKQDDTEKIKRSRDGFERVFSSVLAKQVSLLSHNEQTSEGSRGIKIFDADYPEVNRLKAEMPADVIVERLITRKPAVASPFDVSLSATQPLGSGSTVEFVAKTGEKPLAGVSARVSFVSRDHPTAEGSSVSESRETDADGKVVFDYDGSIWVPTGAMFEPRHSYWAPAPVTPAANRTVNFTVLPRTGPLAWWHHTVGIYDYDPCLGAGIKIGVVDTGVGPNSNIEGVKDMGAFINAAHDTKTGAGRDCANHGSHVCGIIASKPPAGSLDFAGIAPGSDVFSARVFPRDLNATQGDIASAIDMLAAEQGVHVINMSLGSEKPSAIELDAVRYAMEKGTICVCAAGNSSGGPVSYPAAYNETVAVSALGLMGMYPPDTLSAWFTPDAMDKFGRDGFFLARYSSVGDAIVCCAPGTGIISTVPATPDCPAPYMVMDGTSMSAPVVTGTLAACLSRDECYKAMNGNMDRFLYAAKLIIDISSNSLNLNPYYQGYGLTTYVYMI